MGNKEAMTGKHGTMCNRGTSDSKLVFQTVFIDTVEVYTYPWSREKIYLKSQYYRA